MSLFINHNSGPIYSECNVTVLNGQTTGQQPEDVTPEPAAVTSCVFTKKAQKEGKEADILEALQKSVQGRKDKTRAFVHELQNWQQEGYVDAHYNAQVMYDELAKILPIPFGYEAFKKHYNNTRP
jgi:hypothetical protein